MNSIVREIYLIAGIRNTSVCLTKCCSRSKNSKQNAKIFNIKNKNKTNQSVYCHLKGQLN